MPGNLQIRLIRLEKRCSRAAAEWHPPFEAAIDLLAVLLAVQLGDLKPGEPVEEGEARALGLDGRHQLRAAMRMDGSRVFGWSRRHGRVCWRMLAMRDTSLESGMSAVVTTLTALVASLPEAIDAPPCPTCPDTIGDAAEWLCL